LDFTILSPAWQLKALANSGMFISAPAASRAQHADKKVTATRQSLFSPDFANLVTGLHHFVASLAAKRFRELRHVH